MAGSITLATPSGNADIGDAVFSPDGTPLAAAGEGLDGLGIRDASSGKFLNSLDVGGNAVAYAITRDDKSVIVADSGGGVRRFSIATGLPGTSAFPAP